MVTSRRTIAVVITLAVLVPAAGGAQSPAAAVVAPEFRVQVWGERATGFTALIVEYFELRARLQDQLPPVVVTADVRQIQRGTRSLARAIRIAQPHAVEGDFFSGPTSAEIKRVIALVVTATVCDAIMDDNPGAFASAINGSYPSGKSRATMPGLIIASLPPLPDDIQFRFIGSDLILYDVRANTIIDRLPDAIKCAVYEIGR